MSDESVAAAEIAHLRRSLSMTIVERDSACRAVDRRDTEMDDLRRENQRLREAEDRALRVLYHVISTNKAWESSRPNELTDDAIRVGHEFLTDRGWWPAASGAAPPGAVEYEEEP